MSRGYALPLFVRRISACLRYEVPASVAGWQPRVSGGSADVAVVVVVVVDVAVVIVVGVAQAALS